jgi:hypothetical protein
MLPSPLPPSAAQSGWGRGRGFRAAAQHLRLPFRADAHDAPHAPRNIFHTSDSQVSPAKLPAAQYPGSVSAQHLARSLPRTMRTMRTMRLMPTADSRWPTADSRRPTYTPVSYHAPRRRANTRCGRKSRGGSVCLASLDEAAVGSQGRGRLEWMGHVSQLRRGDRQSRPSLAHLSPLSRPSGAR